MGNWVGIELSILDFLSVSFGGLQGFLNALIYLGSSPAIREAIMEKVLGRERTTAGNSSGAGSSPDGISANELRRMEPFDAARDTGRTRNVPKNMRYGRSEDEDEDPRNRDLRTLEDEKPPMEDFVIEDD